MKDNPKQIKKLVISPDEFNDKNHWTLNANENLVSCYACNSNLSYVVIEWGIVAEDNDYSVWGDRSNRTYELREIGLNVYCAECGEFNDDYSKYFYPEDRLVMTFDELEDVEINEIKHCLLQFNQKGNFKPLWKNSKLNLLKEELLEYEKKHPIKVDKKKIKEKKHIKKLYHQLKDAQEKEKKSKKK